MKVQHSSLHFPSLKSLKLDIDSLDSIVSFLSRCPVLETLEIDYYFTGESLTKVSVSPSSGSKRLKSTIDNFTWTYLQILKDSSDVTLAIVGNFQSMVEAFLDAFFSCESEFVNPILNNLRDDEEELLLRLHHSTSKCPLHAPILKYPEFHNLLHLKFIIPCFNSSLLVDVLEKCHMLQVLIIQNNKEEPPPLRTWQPESTTVSECLKSHLTYIHIEGYQGFEDELTFAEYILRNGLVLETMLIFVDISMDKMTKDCSLSHKIN